ncbi:hypothetical protein SDC9_207328 [bioreactor metagenome]|uniref:Uncharacterized protein n=1 Tax=bioreactor metagenome TaxID=1076179 RepID=A0A645J889_9ZZZZ
MLAVTVGSLIEVHKVHVDLFVRDGAVVLGGKVAVRLLQQFQPFDPHFGRAERVHPHHNTGAVVVVVGFAHHIADLLRGLGGHLVNKAAGQAARLIHAVGHFGGAGRHGL